jgi:RNA polymerase sigma-70 factor (ECF subfamily)
MTEERLEAVRRAVAELPASLREVVVLCEWEGLSQAEAATVLGTTVKGVESRLYRARQMLRARLQPWL